MALTQVRARLGAEWVTLAYNESTGRYEGELTPAGTSVHQPGGYFNVEVEAVNGNGDRASLSGTQLPALRLVVREISAPVLTLVSPAPGYLTTASPTFLFSAVDEAGGSGVDPDSAKAAVDGASVPCTAVQDGAGVRIAFTRPGLSEGPHTVTAEVRDYDGNRAAVSAGYIVDTVAPVLILDQPGPRHVVDGDHVEIAGLAVDVTAPAVTVTVNGQAAAVAGGRFSAVVPLAVGENRIAVSAADGAGNVSGAEVYMIRLVTDRVGADAAALRALVERPMEEWTAAELAWFNGAAQRGAYNAADLNRVGAAVGYLSGELARRGYLIGAAHRTDWSKEDAPTEGQMADYLSGVEAVRTAQGLAMPEIPETMAALDVEGANRIEAALVAVDRVLPLHWAWTAGEAFCGEG